MKRNAPGPVGPSFANTWLADLDADEPAWPWLWHGYLAPGCITLLTSPWKSGKTTLISALLTRMGQGGELAGLAARAGKAAVVSEESIEQWRLRKQKFGFGPHICWICRPFRGRPRLDHWQALLEHLLDLRKDHAIDLVVIDPLAAFLPARSESEVGSVMEALLPLQQLTGAGLAVLLLHHPRKQGGPDGLWARGSGALPAHADILIEMAYYSCAADTDRRRKVSAYSRFDATPRSRVIELTESGTDFQALGDISEETFTSGWQIVEQILDEARQKLNQKEIMEHWPMPHPKPSDIGLWRWLDRAVSEGRVCRDGKGRKNDPYRYWNQSLERKWKTDPVLRLLAEQDEALRALGLEG
jgi:hypothetical protein